MKEIMCFGDSNTFGQRPDCEGRWTGYERWTMKLQKLLGNDYHIIEEGYNGRTTIFDDGKDIYRNGKLGMHVALGSHHPLDMIIIMLGTNDAKCRFATTARGIAEGFQTLIDIIKGTEYIKGNPMPKLLLVSPVHIGDNLEACPYADFTEASRQRIIGLSSVLEKLAREQRCLFFDASTVATVGEDQIHLDLDSNKALAIALAEVISNWYDTALIK
ncbi:MAG: GDSL-type esterase/lipase family protein [Spirochaetia bacterium]|nr:GDSL-type esterase/lipase family protein [Spirochaetia bacterium]